MQGWRANGRLGKEGGGRGRGGATLQVLGFRSSDTLQGSDSQQCTCVDAAAAAAG